MSSKLDELRRRAEDAARQLDEKFEIKSKLEKGARATTDALRKGTDAATSAIDAARDEASRLNREHKVTERVSESARRAATAAEDAVRRSGIKDKAAGAASEASKRASEAASGAKDAASDLFGEAKRYYESASGAARGGVSRGRRVLIARRRIARSGRRRQLVFSLRDSAVWIEKAFRKIREVLEEPGGVDPRW
jgi:hypothetical protein